MAKSTELWRECVRWMNECGILDAKHRVAEADAEIGEFATILRDGVLLCLLCNRLCENCIDIKDLQQRPQMAQVHALDIQICCGMITVCRYNRFILFISPEIILIPICISEGFRTALCKTFICNILSAKLSKITKSSLTISRVPLSPMK